MSRLTFCRPQPLYYLLQALAVVVPTAAAAAICSVTLFDFALLSRSHLAKDSLVKMQNVPRRSCYQNAA